MENEFRQKQLELFSAASEESERGAFNRLNSFININLNWENIILLIILCLMLVILSFSLGVENGKRRILKEAVSVEPGNLKPAQKNAASNPVILAQTKSNILQTNAIQDKQPKELAVSVNKFTIQVASFEKKSSLQSEINKLKKMGYDAWVVASGKYNKLYVGRLATKKEAETLQKKLQKIYDDCLIRRI